MKILGILAITCCVISWLYVVIMPNWKGFKNKKFPVIVTPATVYSREIIVEDVLTSWKGPRNERKVKVTFLTEGNLIVVLNAPLSEYDNFQEGTRGVLTYQGEKYDLFEPEK